MSKTCIAIALIAGASAQFDLNNYLLMDRFAGHGGHSNFPLMAASGMLPQDQILPFMAMDSFSHGYSRHSDMLPMMAMSGMVPQADVLPFMMAERFGGRHGGYGRRNNMLPLMAAGILPQANMQNYLLADSFSHGNDYLPLMAATGSITQDQMLPMMMADRFSYGRHGGYGRHNSMLPLMAAGVLPQENMLPFMMADRFSNGNNMLPMMAATGQITQDQMLPFMMADQFSGSHGDNMIPLMAATGAITQDQALPMMLAGGFGRHSSRSYGSRHGVRHGRPALRHGAAFAAPIGTAPIVAAEEVAAVEEVAEVIAEESASSSSD